MKRPLGIDEGWRKELGPDVRKWIGGLAAELAKLPSGNPQQRAFAAAFMGRMIFSCLVDAEAWIETLRGITPDTRPRNQWSISGT